MYILLTDTKYPYFFKVETDLEKIFTLFDIFTYLCYNYHSNWGVGKNER